jgi:hypothetical protein
MKKGTSVFGVCAVSLGGLFLLSTECGNSSSNAPATGGPDATASGSSGGSSGTASGGSSGTGATSGSSGGGSSSGSGSDAGSDGATSDSGPTVDMSVDVLMRNKHLSRDGVYVQPTLTKASIGTMALDTDFSAPDAGAAFKGPLMWAQPLYLSKGPGGAGIFLVVTTGNNVYALDEATGATVWAVNLGTVQQINPATCVDNITRGIIATPVIDPALGPDGFPTMYVSAYVGPPAPDAGTSPDAAVNTVVESLVFALSTKDGSTRPGWPVHASAIQAAAAIDAGVTTFTAEAQNQRGALALVNGTLYVGYGSHGDCGYYRGWVLAIDTADPSKTGVFMTGDQGGAIWAPGGLASDGTGVITVTGNGLPEAGVHTDSEQVIRLTGMAALARNPMNTFYPTGPADGGTPPLWQTLDQGEQDLGSTNPVVVSAGGTTYVTAAGKNGEFFLLNAANFGGTDPGDLVPPGGAYLKISPDRGKVISTPAAYTSPSGTHVVLTVAKPLGCPVPGDAGAGNDGGGGADAGAISPVVMSILVTPGTTPSLNVAWCSSAGTPAPIVTTSDGKSDYIVWYVNAGVLTGVDADNGTTLVTATGTCPYNVRRWTSPIAVKGRIISTGDGHLCSWSVH